MQSMRENRWPLGVYEHSFYEMLKRCNGPRMANSHDGSLREDWNENLLLVEQTNAIAHSANGARPGEGGQV